MAAVTTKEHPLIGKLIRIDHADHEVQCVSRFTADLGHGLMLAKRISPRTGEDFDASHIIVLGLVAQEITTQIFDDWDSFFHDMYCLDCLDDAEVAASVGNSVPEALQLGDRAPGDGVREPVFSHRLRLASPVVFSRARRPA